MLVKGVTSAVSEYKRGAMYIVHMQNKALVYTMNSCCTLPAVLASILQDSCKNVVKNSLPIIVLCFS